MPWYWIFASAESDWGSRGEALCARVPQERLGALLLLSLKPCSLEIFEFEADLYFQERSDLTSAISLVHS